MRVNDLDQPIGPPVLNWTIRPLPPRTVIAGRFCRVEPLDLRRHGPDLYDTIGAPSDSRRWTYLSYGPFTNRAEFTQWLEGAVLTDDPLFYAIAGNDGRAVGLAAYMRIDPAHGVIEVGHLNFSSILQRTAAATEAMYLLMRRAFDELGYRRYEWKCDSLNEPSRRAAARLGFVYEGLFRQATVYKNRSRDTAWYSIIDTEWPSRKAAFETWLAPENIDASGIQRQPLSAFMGATGI
jgi:RimJ/RimL family protein N-acetyltransferase